MRKQTFLLPGLLLLAACFFGCKKESSQTINPLLSQTIDKINTWLDAQTSATDENKNDRLQALRDKLEFTGLRFEELNRGEKLIVVPVKAGLETLYNKGKHPATVLLLVQNAAGIIQKGEIIQYLSENGREGVDIPANTFYKFYHSEKLPIDGRFSFLNLTGRLLYEIGFKNGRVKSFGVVRSGTSTTAVNGPPQDPIGPAPVCIDWYLVTTYYYADGTTEQTEDYLYTTCENSSGGGGGNGNEDEDLSLVETKPKDWIVEQSSYGFWFIISIEEFTAVKIPTRRDGGYFIRATHKRSDIVAVSPEYTWQEYTAIVDFAGPAAKSKVSGKVTYSGQIPTEIYINPTVPHFFSVRGIFY